MTTARDDDNWELSRIEARTDVRPLDGLYVLQLVQGVKKRGVVKARR